MKALLRRKSKSKVETSNSMIESSEGNNRGGAKLDLSQRTSSDTPSQTDEKLTSCKREPASGFKALSGFGAIKRHLTVVRICPIP